MFLDKTVVTGVVFLQNITVRIVIYLFTPIGWNKNKEISQFIIIFLHSINANNNKFYVSGEKTIEQTSWYHTVIQSDTLIHHLKFELFGIFLK